MLFSNRWTDFAVLYAGGGEKYERWGDVFLQRPDPQAIWEKNLPDIRVENPAGEEKTWPAPHAVYHRSETGGGFWEKKKNFPRRWQISYPAICGTLRFWIEPTGFKHTGLFPEQAVNWDFCAARISERVKQNGEVRVLNLFAYTGAATMACAAAGASEVVHVDASRGMIGKAKENAEISGLQNRLIRFIAEDCNRFVDREIRRGRRYQGIIMDPPAYGRGPQGELWKLEDSLYPFVEKCGRLLSDDALFFLVNAYTTGLSPLSLESVLRLGVRSRLGGSVSADELALPISEMDAFLPCGIVGRWIPEQGGVW